jgi:hypothetical protein
MSGRADGGIVEGMNSMTSEVMSPVIFRGYPPDMGAEQSMPMGALIRELSMFRTMAMFTLNALRALP